MSEAGSARASAAASSGRERSAAGWLFRSIGRWPCCRLQALVLVLLLAGAALAQDEAEPSGRGLILGERAGLWQLYRKGGVVMHAILAASIAALAFGIERSIALRASVQIPLGLAGDIAARVSRGGVAAGVAALKGETSALGRMLAAALERAGDGRAGMEEAAAASSDLVLHELRRNVRPLGIVASLAPLLGLLGTVFGMIKAFDRASAGGLGRGEELAAGIAEALITTGAGLIVAIPALLAYHVLRGRAEDLVRRAEAETATVIDRALASVARPEPHDAARQSPRRDAPQAARTGQEGEAAADARASASGGQERGGTGARA